MSIHKETVSNTKYYRLKFQESVASKSTASAWTIHALTTAPVWTTMASPVNVSRDSPVWFLFFLKLYIEIQKKNFQAITARSTNLCATVRFARTTASASRAPVCRSRVGVRSAGRENSARRTSTSARLHPRPATTTASA